VNRAACSPRTEDHYICPARRSSQKCTFKLLSDKHTGGRRLSLLGAVPMWVEGCQFVTTAMYVTAGLPARAAGADEVLKSKTVISFSTPVLWARVDKEHSRDGCVTPGPWTGAVYASHGMQSSLPRPRDNRPVTLMMPTQSHSNEDYIAYDEYTACGLCSTHLLDGVLLP
jgi:hypothetical protein